MTSSYGEARLTGSPHANLADDLGTVSGLIVVFGLLAGIPGVRDLIGASAKNVDWEGDPDNGIFPPIIGLLANLVVVLFALASVFLGFQYLVGKWGSKLSALFGLGITLAAWFPFLVTIALISFQADHENITGPPLLISYPASKSEIVAIAIMGCIGFYGYGGTVIGALTFLHWKMYRYFSGYATTYTASYYRSRLSYYGALTIMVGVVQLALGAFIIDKFDEGQLIGPIITGPFFVLWPELSIAVGVCQILLGCFIMYRSTTPGVGPSSGNKDRGLFLFQASAWFVLLVSVGCQVIGQVALNEDPGPGVFVANVVGFAIFPMYLDVMAHTTPENVTSDMFSTLKDGF